LSYGMTVEDFPDLVEKAPKTSSMKGNPIELRPGEMMKILSQAL